jgi:hypothetical protein
VEPGQDELEDEVEQKREGDDDAGENASFIESMKPSVGLNAPIIRRSSRLAMSGSAPLSSRAATWRRRSASSVVEARKAARWPSGNSSAAR